MDSIANLKTWLVMGVFLFAIELGIGLPARAGSGRFGLVGGQVFSFGFVFLIGFCWTNRLMFRTAWRRRCSFSTSAMRI